MAYTKRTTTLAFLLCSVCMIQKACGEVDSSTSETKKKESYELDEYGRHHIHHPAARCCSDEDCLAADKHHRYAFVTTLRSEGYIMGTRELSCSLKKTNPGIPLIILTGADDEVNSHSAELSKLGEHRTEEDFAFENHRNWRWGLNWIKLRLWEWTEYDALIVIDSDAIVQANITHLFGLPTDFAWVTHNGEGWFDANRGGFLMVRPCMKTFYTMMHYIHSDKHYQFQTGFAEQDFLTWYYRYTAFDLPERYNVNFVFVDEHGMGPDGTKAAVLHFAEDVHKEGYFNAQPNSTIWPYLCYQPQQAELHSI